MKKFFLTESERNQIKSLYQTKGLLNEEYGTIEYTDGGKYTGEYRVEDGRKILDGYGSTLWTSGAKYEGDWKDNFPHGYGTIVYADGRKYVGNWENSAKNGYGTLVYTDGSKYEGNWEDSEQNGYGTLTYPDGTVEQGNWVDGEFQGGGENSTQNDSTTTPPPGDASTDTGSTDTGSTEQPENCDELMELAKKESVYNVCNLQNGKVVIGLKNQGPLVKYIQCVLNQQETELAQLKLDGIFGPKTKEKVEKFQKNNEGLKVDGIVGQKTFEKFNLTTGC